MQQNQWGTAIFCCPEIGPFNIEKQHPYGGKRAQAPRLCKRSNIYLIYYLEHSSFSALTAHSHFHHHII